ncbi:Peroxidase 5 [Dichanthelium oligosanthes]|uniref:Peroxidase n=1 Tax=Dichanthelium oligosanthes TaxID=888268 RepID=A0A1E5W1T8_9POAL|nr:Peroxidase 5 [Dichanthelium oligosanthes]
MTTKRSCLRFATLLAALLSATACLDFGFYDTRCPNAEAIVLQTVAAAFGNNSGVAPALIRMHFHDCFVRGCDGSVLIDSTTNNTAEKDSSPNNPSLRFFDVVDRAKAALEAQCPGVVSCADILAFAARDSVALSGGLGYQVPSGRRDGRISLSDDALNELPPSFFNAAQLADRFAAKNLTIEDLVVLSGAHTIGVSHCSNYAGINTPFDRLYNFSGSPDGIDPALSKAYAFLLKSICPANSSQFFPNTTTFMDLITPTKFDNKYYVGLQNNLGLFISDATLLTNRTMKALVDSFVRSEATWKTKFARSMLKMGQIEVLTGTQGEIRRNCRVINPTSTASVHSAVAGSGSSGFTGVAES